MKIGFIGLGRMGNPMAHRLVQAGFDLTVYDVVPHLMDDFSAVGLKGAKGAKNIAQLASSCDVVITSVQTTDQVKELCLNEEGIFAHAHKHLLYIDCSSIDINVTQELHRIAKTNGIAMLDAPVSGGVLAAQKGDLTIIVGGEDKSFTRAQPILEKLGKHVIHAGPEGRGQAAKICNNLLLGISMIGVSEAFALAERVGLDPKKFYEISSVSSGQCWSMTSYCPWPDILAEVPSSHDYKAGFMARMMLKDLRLAQHAAESVDAVIPLGAVATELYELYVSQGHGDKDFSGIVNLIAGKNFDEK